MTYDSSNIKVLKGLDAVRKRPGMYIGDTDDGTGSTTWSLRSWTMPSTKPCAGYCTHIDVVINSDDSGDGTRTTVAGYPSTCTRKSNVPPQRSL